MTDVFTVPAEQVAARILDGEAVVINLASGVYYGFNAPATSLWSLLEMGPRSSGSLSRSLADAHGADHDEVAGDVRFFLAGLEREGLVERSDGDEVPVEGVLGHGPYVAPITERFEKLDELMLSGE